jgi:ABC-type nitrate/sulfonate/bicarbonate transport system permease component
MSMISRHRAAAGWLVPVTLLLVWEFGARARLLPDFMIAPSAIAVEFSSMALSGELGVHVGHSLVRSLGGFAVGTIAGVMLGLLAGSSPRIGSFFDPLISSIYPVPKVAFLPIIVIWLGLGDASKIATIALSVFFPIFISTAAGARSVPKLLLWAGRSLGASRLRLFFYIELPAALPHILSGMRIGAGLSFIVLFACELFGARSGLGYLIGVAEDNHRFDLMYVAIIAIGALGFLCDRILLACRRRLLRGQILSKEETFV